MAKVIVPKNCVYNHSVSVGGITTSNIINSTYTTNFMLLPEDRIDNGVLGFNININYGMASSTVSFPWTNSVYRYITIKNSLSFNCNFILITVNNLPKIINTGTVKGGLKLRLGLSDNTYIDLLSTTLAVGGTLTIPNQTYYVDLVNKTAVTATNANNLAYNYDKAITYSDSYWRAPQEIHTNSLASTSYTITPNNPFPYIFNNVEFRGPNYSVSSLTLKLSNFGLSSPDFIIYIDTGNIANVIKCPYIFLHFNGLPTFENDTSATVAISSYINISGTRILVDTIAIRPGMLMESGIGSMNLCIDVVNKKLISKTSTNLEVKRAITHL